jgi:hypothetical protein
MTMAAVVPLALLALLPPVAADELGPPAPAGDDAGGFHGFGSFDTHSQAQIATLTGFLNAFREDNSLVGTQSEINGPPANSRNVAAFFERGRGATFVYGVIGGPGGARGTLPDPPPGEANAFYPTGPFELTWSGPITGAGFPQVVDSRFHAKATDVPTGRADGAVTALTDPGYFTIGQATAVSHTEPAEDGVAAEAVSVVHQLQVGPLLIQNIVSRAYAFVPASGDPKGIATTVIDGAKVGDTPVQITDKGIVVADKANPLGQEKVNKAMADAGYPQVRLLPSVAQPSNDGASVSSTAGTLEFVKQDEKFGASNPQGFSGGGFSIGGAEAAISSHRCAPDCGGGAGGVSSGSGTGNGPLPGNGPSSAGGASTEPTPSTAAGGSDLSSSGTGSSATFTTDTSGAGLGSGSSGSSGSGAYSPGASGGLSLPTGGGADSSSTTAVTPPSQGTSSGSGESAAAAVPVRQQAAVAVTELGPKTAEWVRDLYLMAALALGIIFVGQRLARAF